MATLLLASAGAAIGGAVGGSVLGISAVTIGGAIGTVVGSAVDNWVLSSMAPKQRVEGPRIDSLQITSAGEGDPIPRIAGRYRIGTKVIWATDFREQIDTEEVGGGGKGGGGGGGAEIETYRYFASFAVAICEGPIRGIGRVWIDGRVVDLTELPHRLYLGDEDQAPDPLIAQQMGGAPAYRGVAYMVFDDLPLEQFGNRIPQISVEVLNTPGGEDTLEGMARAVTIIPSTGEFTYSDTIVMAGAEGFMVPANGNTALSLPDLLVSLDRMRADLPNLESVSLVVSWFGSDLRCGECRIQPRVEFEEKETEGETWSVGLWEQPVEDGEEDETELAAALRDAYPEVSRYQGQPAYGGTPSDRSVYNAIRELKARGYRVTFYPFILMDIPGNNGLPDPYSDGAGSSGQPAYPWRGRITCSPAAGFAGSPDKTGAALSQVQDFFGGASAADFSADGWRVTYTGDPLDWGMRRFILHYAHLCQQAGVDAFLIGTEMRGLTTIRSGPDEYPAVDEFVSLAQACAIVTGAEISYAADWSEYFGHQPRDGSGDVFFHLDPLWSSGFVDFVAIDNYMPLADWRDGTDHLDAQAGWNHPNEVAYLRSNVEGGEGYDWFYASAADRDAQVRTPIEDTAEGKPWVFRFKDIRSWWSNQHYNRPGGAEASTPTGWVPESKPVRFTELGCPALDRGANQPNVFFDPKSSESFLPYFSRGWRDDAMQRAFCEAMIGYWRDNNPTSSVYGGPMIEMGETAIWTWDARPYPEFPALDEIWNDGENWRLGHWITGRAGSAPVAAVVRDLCLRAGLEPDEIDVSGVWQVAEGVVVPAIESPRASITTLAAFFGLDATESSGVLRFQHRGERPALTVGVDDLVAPDDPAADPIEFARAQETELPAKVRWQAARADEDYSSFSVEAARIATSAQRVDTADFPIASVPDLAERNLRRALFEAWVGRERAAGVLRPSLLALDPGDVVAIEHEGRATPFRLTQLADGDGRRFDATRAGAAFDTVAPGAPRTPAVPLPARFGPPRVHALNLPRLSEEARETDAYVAAIAEPWPGSLGVWRSADGGLSYPRASTVSGPVQIGVLLADLPAGPVGRWDRGSLLHVRMLSGSLASATDEAVLSGQNALAVESAPGEWEVLQFAQADLQPDGSYHLRRLLRGQRGTEAEMGAPAPGGATVVRLRGNLGRLPVTLAEVGAPFEYRVGAASKGPAYDFTASVSFTATGRGLEPFSPAQPRARRLANGDLAIRWLGRSRDLAADNWALPTVPDPDGPAVFDLELLDGSGAVVRTASGLTAPAFTWTSAQQTADVGGPASIVRARISQIGTLGAGAALEADFSITEAE